MAPLKLTAWYISRNGAASGPFATDIVVAMLRDGQLQPLDLVFREGETEWKPAASYRELKPSNAQGASEKQSSVQKDAPKAQASEPMPLPKSSATTGRADPATGMKALSWIVLRPHNSTYLQEGPFETATIIEGLQTGRFQFSQYAWHVGMPRWMRIGDLREFDRRKRSRDERPHTPPPLPDPIAAVLLEDDKDQEAEEFHVVMHGMTKMDMTPNPLESMQALNVTKLGSVGIGGAAADSPEEKKAQERAGHAVSLVVSTPNLAEVPWEQDLSERYPSSRELIDDESSGIHRSPLEDDGGPDPSGFEERTGVVAIPAEALGDDSSIKFDQTPLPFIPAAPMPLPKDAWEKWGRYVAGSAMASVVGVFAIHLAMNPRTAGVTDVTASISAPTTPAIETVSESAPSAEAAPVADSMSEAAAPQVAAAAPDTATTATSAAPLPPAPPPAAPIADFSVVGLKLDRPEGQIVIQGSFSSLNPETPIQVSLKGRLGQILSNLSVRKTVQLQRKGGEIPSLKLKDLKLPPGAYTVEVEAGGAKAKNEIFVGVRDAKFMDKLESHLREISLETQSQKKALFYAAKELDVLARELGQNYGQLRGQPESWSKFYGAWNKRIEGLQRGLADVVKKKVEDQAYPEETASLSQAFASVREVASQYEQAIAQKRDIASDTLTELISELARQKDAIGEATARPTADTPDGML